MNFTAEFIKENGITLINEDNSKLFSIADNEQINKNVFSKPYIIYDILKPKLKKSEIKIYAPPFKVSILNEVGLCLYAIPIQKRKAWAKRQKYIYFIREANSPIQEDAKKVSLLPVGHYLEIDVANKRLRLTGEHISPEKSSTEWFFY